MCLYQGLACDGPDGHFPETTMLKHEAIIRFGAFMAILALMAVWE
jgi:hypothetical protein